MPKPACTSERGLRARSNNWARRSGRTLGLPASRRGSVALAIAAAARLWTGEVAWSDGGDLLWEDQFDSGDSDFATRDGVVVDGSRAFVAGGATGASGVSDDFDWLVRAYDTQDGTLLWEDRFDLASGRDSPLGITTGGGLVFVSGDATNSAGVLVPVIRAHDGRTGALLWQDVGAHQGLFDSAAVHGSAVVAIGAIGEDPSPDPGASFFFRGDWLVRAYDAMTGDLLWEDRFGQPDPVGAVQLDRPVTVAAAGNRVFVGGRGRVAAGQASRWIVRAHDAKNGALLWQDVVLGATPGQANSIAIEGDRLVAAGFLISQLSPFNLDWLIRASDTETGELLWQDVVNRGISSAEMALDLAVGEGRVFAVGTAGATCRFDVVHPDNCDALIRAYELDSGQFLWEDRFDDAPLDEYRSVAAKDDLVFATGIGANDCDYSGLPTNCDLLVRAYAAKTGQLVWEDQVDESGTDEEGNAIAVHGGRVLVTGNLFDGSALFLSDLVVRAYDAGNGNEGDDEHD